MGSLRHGALPQAGAKNESKNTRMSVAQQGVSKSDVKKVSNPSFQDNEALKAARLAAMTEVQRNKAVSNDTMLNSSTTNDKILVSNKILYPKNSIVKENFTVTNSKYPEMNEKAQNILTAPDFIGPNKISETSKVRGLNSFDFAGFSYDTGRKKTATGNSTVTVKQNPVTGETIGDLQNNEIKNEYNAFDEERKAIINSQPQR
jgi:hypothetical protein|tara:strand:- start:121 stop:729 length:609 start_codon:yes stop_codon:yes gene_type:complete